MLFCFFVFLALNRILKSIVDAYSAKTSLFQRAEAESMEEVTAPHQEPSDIYKTSREELETPPLRTRRLGTSLATKEDLNTEVMELWKSLNQGILQNHKLGSSIEDLRTQLHVAKADISSLQGALERSEAERADVEGQLHSANRRLAEVENAAMATRSGIMAVGGEGESVEGLFPQVGQTLEVEKAESEKVNCSAGSSLLDAESGEVEGKKKWWRNSWAHGIAIIGIVVFAVKRL
ncbi:hypothetical protein BSKO_08131 [Bryopsis sp. KO-2023]|nr:hypothetical protein BSKO_08131 [Bryopsis sp. KO-2023]